MSVNGQSLSGLENKEAIKLLKNSGSTVTFEIARRIGRRRCQAPSPFTSQFQSRQDSGETTREPPSPIPEIHHPMNQYQQHDSTDFNRPTTPPLSASAVVESKNTFRRRSRCETLSRMHNLGSGESARGEDRLSTLSSREKTSTMPRKLSSTVGIKVVELHKGPTGLGMQLKGGSDTNLPITVKVVFPGGPAHKGKIQPGDVIIEVNNESFDNITHKDAIAKLKGLPQGKVSLLVRDRTAMLGRTGLY